MEQDFSKRVVIVVRKDLLPWQIANAISHIAAYFGKEMGVSFGTGDFFETKDGIKLPRNSQYPMIIKRANSSEQLHNLATKVRESKTNHIVFVREMIDTSDDSELDSVLKNKMESEIEYLGVGVFGANEEVNTLTKKFGLWE